MSIPLPCGAPARHYQATCPGCGRVCAAVSARYEDREALIGRVCRAWEARGWQVVATEADPTALVEGCRCGGPGR